MTARRTVGNWRSVRSICARAAVTAHDPAVRFNSELKSAVAVLFEITTPRRRVPLGISVPYPSVRSDSFGPFNSRSKAARAGAAVAPALRVTGNTRAQSVEPGAF